MHHVTPLGILPDFTSFCMFSVLTSITLVNQRVDKSSLKLKHCDIVLTNDNNNALFASLNCNNFFFGK